MITISVSVKERNKIMDSTTPAKKLLALKAYLNNLNSVAIAFSSGVDSTFLLKVAHDVLGDQVVAVTARSCSFPVRELKEAEEFCRKEGIRHIIVDSEELDIEGFRHNPRNRCYLCKHELFTKIIQRRNPAAVQRTGADDLEQAVICLPVQPLCLW